jgi:hypothetical protein
MSLFTGKAEGSDLSNRSPCCSFNIKVGLATIGVALAVIFGALVFLGSHHLPLGPINVISEALNNFAFLPLTCAGLLALALGGVICYLRRKSLSQEASEPEPQQKEPQEPQERIQESQQQELVKPPVPVVAEVELLPKRVVYIPEQEAQEMRTYLAEAKAQLTDQERLEQDGKSQWIDSFLEDIERVLQDRTLSSFEQGVILHHMREAVPYRLGKQLAVSPYPLVGIPNFGGYNCFLNVVLQSLVHTYMGDYYFWCPPHKPIAPPAATPLPPPPRLPQIKDYNFDGAKDNDERKVLSQRFDADKARFPSDQREYQQLERAHREAETYRGIYAQEQENYNKKLRRQEILRNIVLDMRQGIAPSRETVDRFLVTIGYAGGSLTKGGGDHKHIFPYICMDGPPLFQDKMNDRQGPVIILGAGSHYKVIVQDTRGFFTINDASVSLTSSDQAHLYQEIEKNRRTWQPYQPTVISTCEWRQNR